jgi:hypothetical protein
MPVRLCVGTKYITEKEGLMGLTEDVAAAIVWNIETTEDDCVIFVSPPSGRRRKDRHLVPKNAQTTEDGRGVVCAPLHAPEAEMGVRKWKIHPDGSCMWYPTDTATSAMDSAPLCARAMGYHDERTLCVDRVRSLRSLRSQTAPTRKHASSR